MSDWDQRQLCSNGACIGVIGPDGTCKVCGRAAPNWGEERTRGLQEPEPKEEEHPVELVPVPLRSDNPEWSERKLCSDGACIGVLGADGKCKVCGRSAA